MRKMTWMNQLSIIFFSVALYQYNKHTLGILATAIHWVVMKVCIPFTLFVSVSALPVFNKSVICLREDIFFS